MTMGLLLVLLVTPAQDGVAGGNDQFGAPEPAPPPAETAPADAAPANTAPAEAAPAEAAPVETAPLDPPPAGTPPPPAMPPPGEVPPAAPAEASAPELPPKPELDAELLKRAEQQRAFRRARQQRRQRELCVNPGDIGCVDAETPGTPGAPRPALFESRAPLGAALLGLVFGVGAGFYYAGDNTQGLVFSLVDAAFASALIGVTVAFNQLVIKNDFRTGLSLKNDERQFGTQESGLFTASWILAVVLVISHAYQAFGGALVAIDTNTMLENFSFVPLGDGGAASLRLPF